MHVLVLHVIIDGGNWDLSDGEDEWSMRRNRTPESSTEAANKNTRTNDGQKQDKVNCRDASSAVLLQGKHEEKSINHAEGFSLQMSLTQADSQDMDSDNIADGIPNTLPNTLPDSLDSSIMLPHRSLSRRRESSMQAWRQGELITCRSSTQH